MDCLHHRAPGRRRQPVLLVMLPGAGIDAADFAAQGLVSAIHRRGLPIDVVATRPALDLYLDGTMATELQRMVIAPAQVQGYRRIWLLGISLGGMGALLYASAHPEAVEGIVLLAPFLGTQGTVAEVAAAGGLGYWKPEGSAATATERQLLLWLQQFLVAPPMRPIVYLGYGLADRFVHGHTMLAERLPRERVVTTAGGHDWETWSALWQAVLDTKPFAKRTAA